MRSFGSLLADIMQFVGKVNSSFKLQIGYSIFFRKIVPENKSEFVDELTSGAPFNFLGAAVALWCNTKALSYEATRRYSSFPSKSELM